MFKALQVKPAAVHYKPYFANVVSRSQRQVICPPCYPPVSPNKVVPPLPPKSSPDAIVSVRKSIAMRKSTADSRKRHYINVLKNGPPSFTVIDMARLLIASRAEEKVSEMDWDKIKMYYELHGKDLQPNMERSEKCDTKYLSKLMDIYYMVTRLIAEFKGGENVMKRVSSIKVTGSIWRKPMFDTYEESERFIDEILNNATVNMEELFVKFLGLLKADFIQFWIRQGVVEPQNHWETNLLLRFNLFRHYKNMSLREELVKKEVKQEVKQEVKEEVFELPQDEKCIHTCSFINDAELKSDFNYDEVKQYLDDMFEKYANDPNTIHV